MLLIGVNRSPYTRRVAITLKAYGLPFEQRDLSGFGNRADVRAANPLGRIPALVLDNVGNDAPPAEAEPADTPIAAPPEPAVSARDGSLGIGSLKGDPSHE